MESFVLQPSHVRGERVVVDKSEAPVELDWHGLCGQFAVSGQWAGRATLRRLQVGDFVGVQNLDGQRSNFIIRTPGAGRSIRWITNARPLFASEVECLYRVDAAEYDIQVVEAAS